MKAPEFLMNIGLALALHCMALLVVYQPNKLVDGYDVIMALVLWAGGSFLMLELLFLMRRHRQRLERRVRARLLGPTFY